LEALSTFGCAPLLEIALGVATRQAVSTPLEHLLKSFLTLFSRSPTSPNSVTETAKRSSSWRFDVRCAVSADRNWVCAWPLALKEISNVGQSRISFNERHRRLRALIWGDVRHCLSQDHLLRANSKLLSFTAPKEPLNGAFVKVLAPHNQNLWSVDITDISDLCSEPMKITPDLPAPKWTLPIHHNRLER